MARKPHQSDESPACPTGIGETAEELYSRAAETRAVEAVRETSADLAVSSATRSEDSFEGALSGLRECLLPFPSLPIDVGRYRVVRKIGAGGMGVVFEAVTRDGARRVALKTLQRMSPSGLLRFKREFRATQSLVHPNLIGLHELVAENDAWFFTMELLEGTSFLAHVRRDARPRDLGATQLVGHDDAAPGRDRDEPEAPPPFATPAREEAGFDEGRLRAALRQLALGVAALHDAGKIHRDLNPGNVFVTPEGRVVVIDFGLIGSLAGPAGEIDSFDGAGGTPGYMAPEQADRSACEASDWYALGIMLYEALTGQTPFRGTLSRILAAQRLGAPAPPSALAAGVPADLEALCLELLRPAPKDRPGRDEVLRRLGVPRDDGFPRAADAIAIWVGREDELGALDAALARATAAPGRPVTAWIHGAPGIGKSALLQRFGAIAAEQRGALVLAGRCYERETVPYNAVDALVDALTHHLRGLPEETATALLPPDIAELARLFPVLQGVAAVAALPRRRPEVRDPDELRRRAFACLRALLARLGAARPLVLCLDDLQWGDLESARLLAEVLGPRGEAPAPALLLVGAYRSDEAAASALLRELRGARGAEPERLFVGAEIALGPLAPEDALRLARASAAPRAEAAAIAAAAEGNPFLIEELGRGSWSPGELSLEALLRARIARLPAPARRLLAVLAVAGRPVPQEVAAKGAALEAEAPAALHALRCGRLVRVQGRRAAPLLEVAHDRLRAAALAGLDARARAACHLDLARALEAGRAAEPEVLALHFLEAGRFEEAAAHLADAAGRATAALAFDHAADLYSRALALGAGTPRARRELTERRADALASAGRPAEAARLYVEAAEGAAETSSLGLRCRAAEQLLVSGRVGEGLARLLPVLADLGLDPPPHGARALVTLGLRWASLRLRGLRVRERRRRVGAEERAQLAACQGAALGLAGIAPVPSAIFALLGLQLALDAGEIEGAALGLAAAGADAFERGAAGFGAEILAEARRLAEACGEPAALAGVELHEGLARFAEGRFAPALAHADAALALYRDRGAGARKEQSRCRALALRSLLALGDLTARARRALAWLHDAEGAEDVFASTEIALAFAPQRLAAGEPRRAAAEAREARRRFGNALLPDHEASLQHLAALVIEARAALYQGLPREALRRLDRGLPALERAHLLRGRTARVEVLEVRGVASAAAAILEADPRLAARLLRAAEADAARLDREELHPATAAAALIRARVALARRLPDAAAVLLRTAALAFDTAAMRLHAACARRAEGEILGGEGRARVAAADAALEAEGVRDPARWAAMLTGAIR